jgi:P4 family phage/plasmid primase-like protien
MMLDSKVDNGYMIKGKADKRSADMLDRSTIMMKEAVGKCNFCVFSGSMYFFNGRYYESIDKDEFEFILDAVMDKRGVPGSEQFRSGIYRACWRRGVGNNVDQLNRALVCFTNGVINFADSQPELKPHNSKYPVFYMLPYPYNPKAVCPSWELFLEEVLPDKTLRMNLQEFLGLVFINRSQAKIETMMWLHGNGANGKSVIFDTIMGVFGSKNVSNFDIKDLADSGQRERNVAAINGKLLNYCSDVDSKTILNDSIKALISGEPMVGRPMYKDSFTVYDIPLMMGNTNRVPYFKDAPDAWLRRIRPIPFEITIPEERQDKGLSQKMAKEYSGILNWILEGRKRIIKQGFHFTQSDRIDAFLRSYKQMGNTVKQFEDFLGIQPMPKKAFDNGKTILASSLYFRYRAWAEMVRSRVGDTKMTENSFYTAFAELGYLRQKSSNGIVFRYFGNVTIDEFI